MSCMVNHKKHGHCLGLVCQLEQSFLISLKFNTVSGLLKNVSGQVPVFSHKNRGLEEVFGVLQPCDHGKFLILYTTVI